MKDNKITVTDLQRKPGEIMMRIIRGEEIILTRNGHDFARLVPIETHPKHLYKPRHYGKITNIRAVEESSPVISGIKILENEDAMSDITGHKCEAPIGICRRVDSDQYMVEYFVDEGLEKRKVWLCPEHAKRTREAGQSIYKLIQP